MPVPEVCPRCRLRARREKSIWSTNRAPVHVFVCNACEHTFIVREGPLDIPRLLREITPAPAQ